LLAALRHTLGGVYSVSVEFGQRSLANYGLVTVGFDCDPQNVERLVEVTVSELHVLGHGNDDESSGSSCTNVSSTASGVSSATSVDKSNSSGKGAEDDKMTHDEAMALSEMGLASHKQALQNDSSWLFWLLDSYKHRRLHEAMMHEATINEAMQSQPELVEEGGEPSETDFVAAAEERARWVEAKAESRTYGKEHRLYGLAASAADDIPLASLPEEVVTATSPKEGGMRAQMQSVLRRVFDRDRHVVISMVPKGGAGSTSSL
jgi:hypothetical protein